VNIAMTSSYNGAVSSTEHKTHSSITKAGNLDSSVIIVTRMRVGRSGLESRERQNLLSSNVLTGCGAHPASYSMGTMGNEGSFPEGKAAGV